ncbi:MAG: glycosyl transferase family 1, partial [Deltaproteobacteria bacterium]
MKITLIGLTYPFRGGIAHYTTLLCRELRGRHSVQFISLKKQYPGLLFPGKTQIDDSRETITVENDPVIHPLLPWTWISAFLKIKDFSPDLALFQWWHPFFAPSFGTLARMLKGWCGTKIAFLCHNVRPHEPTRLDTFLLAYAFKASDHFIVHSEPDRRILI